MRATHIFIFLTVLFFSSFSCDDGDNQNVYFEIYGTVRTEEGLPIEGIKVSVSGVLLEPDLTSVNGEFSLSGRMEWLMRSLDVICMDIDGKENGGEFMTTRQQVHVRKNKAGRYVMTTNVVMLKAEFQNNQDDFTPIG